MNAITFVPSGPAPVRSLDHLFSPRSVAIVGATANLDAIGGQPIRHLQAKAFSGRIYPVNPRYEEIAGLRCYPDLASLPETPDLVVVAVAARLVRAVVETATARGVPAIIIFSSGFAESGEDGARVQAELRALADAAGTVLVGPNCQGFMNIADGIHVGFGAPYALEYRPGQLSLTSQSGAFGNSLVMGLDAEGLGLRHYISTGNEAAVTTLDCIAHMLEDPGNAVVAGYVEGMRDAARLREIGARALELGKPLVLWKVGNTPAGAEAAASHTANLAGGSAYYDGAFRQYGIVAAHDIGDMADVARALLTRRRPRGSRVGVVTLSGGAGIAIADRCFELGLTLPPLPDKLQATLKTMLPDFASLANPLDVTAAAIASPETFAASLRAVIESRAYDMLALALAALSGPAATRVAQEIAALARSFDIPILVAWNGPPATTREAYHILAEAGVPLYASPVRCARGLDALWQVASAARRDGVPVAANPVGTIPAGEAAFLDEFDSKRLLAGHGIPVTQEHRATSRDEAARQAEAIGFPVVLKILSPDLPHKSEVGGVKVGLADRDAVLAAYDDLQSIPDRVSPRPRFDGVLVQEMVRGGTEVILGGVRDPAFGPLVMFGTGGIYAEIFKDVSFRLAPLARRDAEAMVDGTRIAAVLAGARGRPPGDREGLIAAILALSQLMTNPDAAVTDVDVNPLFVLPDRVVVGDALVKVGKSGGVAQ